MTLKFTEKDCLEAAVVEIVGEPEVRKAFAEGKVLKVKLGIDPTSSSIHLGRSIAVWRLRAFQELGHEIHLIIGDFTGQVGDTSDKESERPMLTKETVLENMKTYIDQLWMILNREKESQVTFHLNSEWLEKLSFGELCHLADAFSVNQFIKRELVAKRIESGSRVSLREMLYPVMQGYDSVMIKADVELGGTDQRFNLLAGRTLQEHQGQPAQSLIIHPLISGTDGRKMSSSWGNVINLLDTPQDKFGRLMSIPDGVMGEYLHVLPLSAQPFDQTELQNRLTGGENPRDLKMALAWNLVALYHGEEEAEKVKTDFTQQFSEGIIPENLPEISISLDQPHSVVEVLADESNLQLSRNEIRRLIEQGAVEIGEKKIEDIHAQLTKEDLGEKTLVRVGKRTLFWLKTH